jgi:hypothetical protein
MENKKKVIKGNELKETDIRPTTQERTLTDDDGRDNFPGERPSRTASVNIGWTVDGIGVGDVGCGNERED